MYPDTQSGGMAVLYHVMYVTAACRGLYCQAHSAMSWEIPWPKAKYKQRCQGSGDVITQVKQCPYLRNKNRNRRSVLNKITAGSNGGNTQPSNKTKKFKIAALLVH